MAHFAKVLDNKVINVIVAEPDFFDNFVDDTPGEWIQTSYNMKGGVYHDPETGEPAADQTVIDGNEARERKNFASVGGNYDPELDVFYGEKPYDSWILNTTTYLWEAPVAYPSSETVTNQYAWDEESGSWIDQYPDA